jgi:capsular exopolysaccharide synthesis family protein
MNDLIPMPPSDSGLQLLEPMKQGHEPAAPKFRLQKLWLFLRQFWWIPVITLALSLSVAVVIFFRTPPIFYSVGSMWETEKLRLPDGAAFTEDRENYLGTQTELLRSKMLRDLTLNTMRAADTNSVFVDENGDPLPVEIEVGSTPKSSVYMVQASSANPAFTPLYLNALMEQYLEYRKNIRSRVSSGTLASISEQVQRLERDMKVGQEALNEYQRSNNLAVLEEESTQEAAYLAKLKTELSDYQLQFKLLAAKALETDSGDSTSSSSKDTIFDSLNNSSTARSSAADRQSADKEIQLLKLERERLAKNLRPNHPKILKLNQDITRAQRLIEVYHQQSQEQIAAAREALLIKIDSLQEAVKDWEAKIATVNERVATADSLKQNVLRNQGLYDRLTSLLQNVDISRNIDQETLSILEPASPARRSYSEAKTMLSQSFIIGLGLGLGIIFLIALRDDRFNSLVEVTERFGDTVVGQVPDMPEMSEMGPLVLLRDNDDRHMFAESCRNLRSALLYLTVDGKRPRVLLVTSAVPNEGKSTIATNLARAMALGGSKVLLVDGDLRKGHIHERLALPSKPGLHELLREPENLEQFQQFIQKTDLPNFSFMARGNVCRNPGDLFLRPNFTELLAKLRAQYDYVLIDSSPVFAADDSSTLAPRVDGTLFVVRSRFTHARAVREALEILFQRQARVLGLILNRADSTASSYYSYKYAEYYAVNTEAADEKS